MAIESVAPNDLIEKVAEKLKALDTMKAPEWAVFVKTGVHKERPPEKEGWWYVRAASVLRTVQLLGPIGVSKLRTKYGGNKRRGGRPPEFRKGSGSIIRKILQQLEKSDLIRQTVKGVHKGRVVTPKGQSILDRTALDMIKHGKVQA